MQRQCECPSIARADDCTDGSADNAAHGDLDANAGCLADADATADADFLWSGGRG